jgi:hypothetical protein
MASLRDARRLAQWSGGDASDTDGKPTGELRGSERVKRLPNDRSFLHELPNTVPIFAGRISP